MWGQFHLKPSSVTGGSCLTSIQPSMSASTDSLWLATSGRAVLLDSNNNINHLLDAPPPPDKLSAFVYIYSVSTTTSFCKLSRMSPHMYDDKTFSYPLIPSCHSLLPFCLGQSIVISHTFIVSLSNCCWPICLSAFSFFMPLWFTPLHLPITVQSTQIYHCQQPLAFQVISHQNNRRQGLIHGRVILFLDFTDHLEQNTLTFILSFWPS